MIRLVPRDIEASRSSTSISSSVCLTWHTLDGWNPILSKLVPLQLGAQVLNSREDFYRRAPTAMTQEMQRKQEPYACFGQSPKPSSSARWSGD